MPPGNREFRQCWGLGCCRGRVLNLWRDQQKERGGSEGNRGLSHSQAVDEMAMAKAEGQLVVKNELKCRCEGAADGIAVVVGEVELDVLKSRGSTRSGWLERNLDCRFTNPQQSPESQGFLICNSGDL